MLLLKQIKCDNRDHPLTTKSWQVKSLWFPTEFSQTALCDTVTGDVTQTYLNISWAYLKVSAVHCKHCAAVKEGPASCWVSKGFFPSHKHTTASKVLNVYQM